MKTKLLSLCGSALCALSLSSCYVYDDPLSWGGSGYYNSGYYGGGYYNNGYYGGGYCPPTQRVVVQRNYCPPPVVYSTRPPVFFGGRPSSCNVSPVITSGHHGHRGGSPYVMGSSSGYRGSSGFSRGGRGAVIPTPTAPPPVFRSGGGSSGHGGHNHGGGMRGGMGGGSHGGSSFGSGRPSFTTASVPVTHVAPAPSMPAPSPVVSAPAPVMQSSPAPIHRMAGMNAQLGQRMQMAMRRGQ